MCACTGDCSAGNLHGSATYSLISGETMVNEEYPRLEEARVGDGRYAEPCGLDSDRERRALLSRQ